MLPFFFSRWCWRYVTHYAAVDATFYTTARVNSARFFSAIGEGVMLPILLPLVRPFALPLG